MSIAPLDQMPMLLRECSQAAFYVQGKFSDELPVHQFTAEAIGEQAVMFDRAAEEADPIIPAFQADEQNLREEIEAAQENLEEALTRLAEAHEMETRWPCTGCHLVKAAVVVIAQERVWLAEHRLKVAEEALETMERVLAMLPAIEWTGPCEEVMTELDRFDPQGADEIRQFLITHRDGLENLGHCTAALADAVDELPRKFFSDIRGYIDEIASLLMRMSGHADDTEIEFRRLHAVEIMRIDEPRPAEEVWDIGQNDVTSPEVWRSGPRNGRETHESRSPEEPHDSTGA
jgi:hypothetical protein